MYYKRVSSGETVIEFHNNWLGEETVIANGQIVSKKSSIMGTSHPFSVFEDGQTVKYILITKVTEMLQVQIDIVRNGEMIIKDEVVPVGRKAKDPAEKIKKTALVKLNDYDLDGALTDFETALEYNVRDPETHFHMACAYSVKEDLEKGFESLRKAVEYGLSDTEAILNHDMLAYIRIHPAFQSFFDSGYSEYDLNSSDV